MKARLLSRLQKMSPIRIFPNQANLTPRRCLMSNLLLMKTRLTKDLRIPMKWSKKQMKSSRMLMKTLTKKRTHMMMKLKMQPRKTMLTMTQWKKHRTKKMLPTMMLVSKMKTLTSTMKMEKRMRSKPFTHSRRLQI